MSAACVAPIEKPRVGGFAEQFSPPETCMKTPSGFWFLRKVPKSEFAAGVVQALLPGGMKIAPGEKTSARQRLARPSMELRDVWFKGSTVHRPQKRIPVGLLEAF